MVYLCYNIRDLQSKHPHTHTHHRERERERERERFSNENLLTLPWNSKKSYLTVSIHNQYHINDDTVYTFENK